MRKIVVSGNCQMAVIIATLQLIFPLDKVVALNFILDPQGDKLEMYRLELCDADIWLVISRDWSSRIYGQLNINNLKIISFPNLEFRGFHPDLIYILEPNSSNTSPVYQSSLIACGYKIGLTQNETYSCFNEIVFGNLGFHDSWKQSIDELKWRFDNSDLNSHFLNYIRHCQRLWVFMYTINHPHVEAIIWLAKLISLEIGATKNVLDMDIVLPELLNSVIWPIYPSIANSIGLTGSLNFFWSTKVRTLNEFINIKYIELDQNYNDKNDIKSAPNFIDLIKVEQSMTSFLGKKNESL